MIQFLLLSICYAAAFYISTSLANYYSPLMMMGMRGLISGSLILTFAYLYNGKIVFQFSKYKLQYFCAIIFGFLVPFVLHSAILDKLPPVDISVIATIEPILTYILAAYFFKEKLSSRQFWLLFLGTFFAFSAIFMESNVDHIALISWQLPFIVMISITLAIGWLSVEKLVKLNEPAMPIVGLGLMTTGLIATILAFQFGQTKITLDIMPIALFFILILAGDLIVHSMRAKLSAQYSATLLSLICIFTPFVVALHEEIFAHKHYSYQFFLMMIPALVCFMAFYREEVQNKTV